MMQFQNGQNMDKIRLKEFTHAQWGSIVGQEYNIRVAVLKDEIDLLKSKLEPHDTGHIHTTISTLQHRVRELESKKQWREHQYIKSFGGGGQKTPKELPQVYLEIPNQQINTNEGVGKNIEDKESETKN